MCRSPLHKDGGLGFAPSEVRNMTFGEIRIHTSDARELDKSEGAIKCNSFREARAMIKQRKERNG